ncbi:tyrosine-type recombinase/integrase [Clostridium gasigenes]|uniref:tyrosine-type recombinase/integrase n=1 Tax=Clostridium gasigenes TaxID=94869 RepID=UPI001623A4FA|nr:tyrosine-type recombinase/integrase [Clostridium gasigenes]MBB6623945.1 tyrosine-type recombinase/integrase [Clostridium gasigenes]
MNKVNHLQLIKSNQQSKYEEIIEYLKQDDGYWLENDKWDINDMVFRDNNLSEEYKTGVKYIKLDYIDSLTLKNEIKYFLIYSLKNKYFSLSRTLNEQQQAIKYLIEYIENYSINKNTFKDISIDNGKWNLFLINEGLKLNKNNQIYNVTYRCICNVVIDFIKDFYDEREETEKDIWSVSNIPSVKYRATSSKASNKSLNFTFIPNYYRELIKKYFRTIITRKSFSHCYNTLTYLNYFFDSFYSRGYTDSFLENLSRNDIEKYIVNLMNERIDKSKEESSKYISQLRIFIEKIQIFEYDKAPKTDVNRLIFNDDIPQRERPNDIIKRVKFVPEPILRQLDNNIMDLDRPQYVPVYILLRETGWRGTDILNLRFHNCLEQIWNGKEQSYNYYLCGEITKTGIAQLKIPIRDKVAEMVQKSIDKANASSTEKNNPKKYLFNTYQGKLKGIPLNKQALLLSIKRLIKEKDIRDVSGELYHFRLHSLRHSRAKEYIEQGMGISIIQQILGHQSLQMTVHYATVSENTLYEKWKVTEDLDLFRVNIETHELQQVVLDSEDRENLIRYEYVKKNLDAVRVPFGVCFKASKIPCKQQMNHCLTCASFCTTTENVPEYEEEIQKVKSQIEISDKFGRELWAEKNKGYLELLEKTLGKVKEHKLVHKNGKSREDS